MGTASQFDPAEAINERARAFGLPFHCDSQLAFDHPELIVLRNVWRNSAAGLALPKRADFGAQSLKNVLKHLAIVERVSAPNEPVRYRVEYLGSYLAAILGDQTGRMVEEWVPSGLLPRWMMLFDAVLAHGIPLRIASGFGYAKLGYAAGEMFIAPLSDEAGQANLVVICLYIKPREDVAAPDEGDAQELGAIVAETVSA